jgi:biotin carboxyl carrier protein
LHYKGRVHSADLVHVDKEKKTVILRIAGKKFSVRLKEPVDQLLDQLGISSKVAKKINKLSAPMPGLVLKVLAEPGKTYQAGEALLVLEAMKMENVFKAADNVTVKEILVDEGQSVEKGQVLIVFAST